MSESEEVLAEEFEEELEEEFEEELAEFDEQEQDDDGLPSGADRLAPVGPAPGCAISFYLDNKLHHAVCLAVIDDELLLEHKGASRCFLFVGKVVEIVPRLRFGVATATIIVGGLKACRYRSVPKKWLWKMLATGQTWKGIERGGGRAPSPADLLEDNAQMELF